MQALHQVRAWLKSCSLSLAFCTVLLVLGCAERLSPGDSTDALTMYINAAQVPCSDGIMVGRTCLQYKLHEEDAWYSLYAPIAGFLYEPGYIYKIQVLKVELPHPTADASPIEYRLLKVLSKQEPSPITGRWQPVKINGKSISTHRDDFFEISTDKSISTMGNNTAVYAYTLSGEQVSFSMASTTDVMTTEVEIEFNKALASVAYYLRKQDTLFLLSEGKVLIELKKSNNH